MVNDEIYFRMILKLWSVFEVAVFFVGVCIIVYLFGG